ncbi:trypsin-like peptidase domain-containing protein [Streptomyces sp. AcE210]|uniref:trypsin-like peptidase domain-containing protein n=1 Tax=Streptomyces sp. AcE210 TaxID=2292703 RepID=UPI000E2FF5FF|nr:trypsin-like peptidase domain-containing protein [Streptomyces sp. AcE210]RFC72474.1 PDZ domain-containing protein [Streptomyces sp. AcE210]
MDEGKPTKAKWWSRPRPTGGAPRDDGDFELAEPAPAPVVSGSEDVPYAAQTLAGNGEGSGDGASGAGAGEGSGDSSAVADAVTAEAPGGPAQVAGAGAGGAEAAQAGDAVVADGSAGAPGEAVTVDQGAVQQTRPRPLHAPDPYGTPPYGEPGPWAPAPPVQHPAAATPAQGTAVPSPAHGTPVPPEHGTPPPYAGGPIPHAAPYAPHPVDQAPVPVEQQAHHAALPLAGGSAGPGAVPGGPGFNPPPPGGPWQRYDPWNAPAPADGQRRGTKRGRRLLVVWTAVVALVAGGIGGLVGTYLERDGSSADVELPQSDTESVKRDPGSIAGIAARALPGVVTIHVSGSDAQGTGTGFVLDAQGHILTNNHVVEPAGSSGDISVTFSGGETAKAEVIGHDSGYDLAVVKVTGVRGLKPLALGNSENVQVGDPVVAIGAPFDLANTVTSGIISAKERPITAGGEKGDGSDISYVDALQTDAPINPGNSGGPLVDAQGRVIGINSAIRSADSGSDLEGGQAGSIGLGFAIPINQGKRVAEELINTGRATHPVIGVTLDMDYSGDGARVATKGNNGGSPVNPGGPGAKAGIEGSDVVTAVDGARIHSAEELIVKIRSHRPEDRLDLTVERDGKERKVTLVLGSADGS